MLLAALLLMSILPVSALADCAEGEHQFNEYWYSYDSENHFRPCTVTGCRYDELQPHELEDGYCEICGYKTPGRQLSDAKVSAIAAIELEIKDCDDADAKAIAEATIKSINNDATTIKEVQKIQDEGIRQIKEAIALNGGSVFDYFFYLFIVRASSLLESVFAVFSNFFLFLGC